MIRMGIAVLLGAQVTAGLFYFMATMIGSGHSLGAPSQSGPVIEFVRLKRDTSLEQKQRAREIKKPKLEPPRMLPKIAVNRPQVTKTALTPPPMELPPLKIDGGALLAGAQMSNSGSVTPLVRVQPIYPRQAALKRLEGWVQLKFDITESGSVTNVEILDSNPKRIFNRAATRALLKWKFRPEIQDNHAVMVKGQMVQLDFKLTE